MPRKPNYQFERSQRAKRKAEKKAERVEAKAQKSQERQAANDDVPENDRPEET